MPMLRLPGFIPSKLGLLLAGPLAATLLTAMPARADAFVKTGLWEMTQDNGHRECRMVLRSDAVEPGLGLGLPPGCRHAFPILGKVTIWVDAGESGLRLEDAGGQPVLNFAPAADALTATGPEGESFKLQPVEPARRAALTKASAEAADAARASAAAASAASVAGEGVPAAAPLKKAVVKPRPPLATLADVAGHYAVLRDQTHDTGCMVTLDEKQPGPKTTLKARLAPACRDQGIIIFDPVGWAIEGGRLVLMARKGHTTHLDPQDDGSWMKDPSEGKSLSLKKM